MDRALPKGLLVITSAGWEIPEYCQDCEKAYNGTGGTLYVSEDGEESSLLCDECNQKDGNLKYGLEQNPIIIELGFSDWAYVSNSKFEYKKN